MTLIRNAHDLPQVRETGYFHWVADLVFERWPGWEGRIDWVARDVVFAEINASRWIVHCPLAGCNEAIHTAPGLPFFCPECLNMTHGGIAYQVVFPAEMTDIEQVLSVRPLSKTRNWLPGESLDFLVAENRIHGLPGGIK